MITLGGRILIVGVIVGLTVLLAYASPFPSAVRVTIGMIGVTLAFVVGARLRARSELMEYDEQVDSDEHT